MACRLTAGKVVQHISYPEIEFLRIEVTKNTNVTVIAVTLDSNRFTVNMLHRASQNVEVVMACPSF